MLESALNLCMVADSKLSISGEKEKESSSDWSSSDEDEDGDDANFNPLRPSTHSALQAQWEWRAMGESLSEKWVNNKLYGCINVP